jgi:hypothetical protein
LSTLAAEEVIRKPLSISLEKLRRAQLSLIRRKRGSKVRVSFSHQQPVAYIQRQQRSGGEASTSRPPTRTDPPWIPRQYDEPNDKIRQPAVHAPVRWVEDHRPLPQVPRSRQAPRKRTPYPLRTPYPIRQDDGCCDDSFDGTKEHRYWGNMPQPDMSAPLNAKPSIRPPPGPSIVEMRPPRRALGYPGPYVRNGQARRASRHLGRPERAAVRLPRDKRREKPPIVRTPEEYYREREPVPNSKRCGIADPEV